MERTFICGTFDFSSGLRFGFGFFFFDEMFCHSEKRMIINTIIFD